MHHLYPLAKGDPLCPLGFHPQVRWPTRCKRCFRDYKEHGSRKKEDEPKLGKSHITASTPILSANNESKENTSSPKPLQQRSWSSSSNLLEDNQPEGRPASWTSTSDLAGYGDDSQADIPTFSLTLPRKKVAPADTGQQKEESKVTKGKNIETVSEKARKLRESVTRFEPARRIQVKELKAAVEEPTNHDVQFLIQVKSKVQNSKADDASTIDDDLTSIAGTETTDTTLVGVDSDLQDQIESLKDELDTTKAKCERLEREKSDLLLRRLASYESTISKTTATEVLKLQQRCNELQTELEDIRDDKKYLSLKVKEMEEELDGRPTLQATQRITDELKGKLLAAETLCEELMDENEDMKKELRDLEEEIEEMQDNFREDQADEYTSLKKELEQTTKNCRILSFKLRKCDRKVEQLETEKVETENKLKELSAGQPMAENLERIKKLEVDLNKANELNGNLRRELDETSEKLVKAEEASKVPTAKKKAPLAAIGKIPSGEKIPRASLIRGNSQEDPAQLMRDLQDSIEREADLKEQLKFAEEEAQILRKRASRAEDDNESLLLQLKKMASKARSRKLSPTSSRLAPDANIDKDEGISDDDDPAELRLQLELNEQETGVLRRKVENMESEAEKYKQTIKELQDSMTSTGSVKKIPISSLADKKLKALEDESRELRKKLSEKEKDCEKLTAELTVCQKRSKTLQKSKSLDGDQQTVDLKRQLQVIEQETTVLRTKLQNAEQENEKLQTENKKLQLLRATKKTTTDKPKEETAAKADGEPLKKEDDVKVLKMKLLKLEKERDKLKTVFDEMKDHAAKDFRKREAKVPTDLTTKLQLKRMVNDLEVEVGNLPQMESTAMELTKSYLGEMLLALQKSEESKGELVKQIEALRNKSDAKPSDETNKKLSSLEKELAEQKTLCSKEKVNSEKLKQENDSLKNEIKSYKDSEDASKKEITKLNSEIKSAKVKKSEIDSLNQKIASLESDLAAKDKLLSNVKAVEAEKAQLQSQISELQEKLKSSDAKLSEKKDSTTSLEKELKELKLKYAKKESEATASSKDKTALSKELSDLKTEVQTLNAKLNAQKTLLEEWEASKLKTGNEKQDVQMQLLKNTTALAEAECKLKVAEESKKSLSEQLKKTENDYKKELASNEKKIASLETDLQAEKSKGERVKNTHEKEQKNRELELGTLKGKIRTLEQQLDGGKKRVKGESDDRVKQFENELEKAKRDYEDLTAKYEILEEEHVVTKAQLVMDKEAINSQLNLAKQELDGVKKEMKLLQEMYDSKQDVWRREKIKYQETERNAKLGENWQLENMRLKTKLVENDTEVDHLRKHSEMAQDQLEHLRRENDELRKKLDDFDRVSKVQRAMSVDSTTMDKEMHTLKTRLVQIEKLRKTDLAQCKMRYDGQISIISEELKSLQGQVSRFKRERDNFRHMFEGAQKTISELKSGTSRVRRGSKGSTGYDELDDPKGKIVALEQQISCMEDELSEVRLESSKLKTELVSERSSWEIKLSEMQSKLNEVEEDRILSSGRTKIPGLRTRMELAWQKERDEQQRLLQETSTLARDLRQTLFEVERERDKERLEAKRKQDQLKKSSDEDQDENRKKLTELQCDLLELRDAHAKLRTTNEKLRREKERYEKERSEMKTALLTKKRSDQLDDKRVLQLLDQVEDFIRLAPGIVSGEPDTPTPPRRLKGPKSRESSPNLERAGSRELPSDYSSKLQQVLQRLKDASDDLRRSQRTEEDAERARRMGMRRAASTENDSAYSQPSLRRKSLSLEQTSGPNSDQYIWKRDNDDSLSSLHSLDGEADIRARMARDSSMDSRLSGGSTHSDVLHNATDKKKKTSLMGKLKKLTKSRSIDEPKGNDSSYDSDVSVSEDHHGSRKDLKDRITGMFKRGGSSSRSNSLERRTTPDTSSTQRPLMRN